MTLHARFRHLVLVVIVLVPLATVAASASADLTFSLVELDGTFEHDGYDQRLAGDALLAKGQATLVFPVGLGDEPCSAVISARVPDDERLRATGGQSLCLAAPSATDDTVNRWINGTAVAQHDPTLRVALDAGGTTGAPVHASLFIRRCDPGDTKLMRYGTLVIAAGGLEFGDDGLAITDASITTDPDAWDHVRHACGSRSVDLPAASPGTGTATAKHTSRGSHAGARVAILRDTLVELTYNGLLGRADAAALTHPLDTAMRNLRRANVAKARAALHDFELALRHTTLDQKTSLRLEFGATLAREQIDADLLAPDITLPPSCPTHDDTCEYGVLHVEARTKMLSVPDGSAMRPYTSISAALAAATARGWCGVEVRVAKGTYREALAITIASRIVAADGTDAPVIFGRISNTSGAPLEIRNIRILDAPDARGALFVEHPCSATSLHRVTIERASNYGIQQRGGTLTAFGTTVRQTRASPGSAAHGTGVRLTSVRATLSVFTSDDNASGALLAEAGSVVHLGLFSARGTGFNPYVNWSQPGACSEDSDGIGAVVARGGAHVDMRYSVVSHTDNIGVMAVDDAVIDGIGSIVTHATRGPNVEQCTLGHGAVALQGGHVTLRNFTVEHAFCGVLITLEGQMDLHNGIVSDNYIGACVYAPGYLLSRLNRSVLFLRNESTIETGQFPNPLPRPVGA